MEKMSKENILFTVNGNAVELMVDPSKKLLHVLREDLDLTGAKEGCGKGHCGTCSVLVDGEVLLSCLIPIHKVAGKQVTTIEGIGNEDHLHPVQQAFVETGAIQCGFCTPGMIVAGKGLLDKNISPTEEEIKKRLSHNLCRCTGYKRIIEAVHVAAGRLRGESPPIEKNLRAGGVGERVISGDAIQKAVGTTKYAADLKMDNMLVAKVLRSSYAHARILNIDTWEALKVDGVVGVFTGHDVPGFNTLGYLDPKDHPILATEKVRHLGDSVGLVAAESLEQAEIALGKIKVTYAPLPIVSNAFEALRDEAPKIHEMGNLLMERKIVKGDVTKGFSGADIIVENKYETPFVEHAYLEPEAGIAYVDDSGRIVIQSGSQDSHHIQGEVSLFLGIPPEKVRVIQTPVGGAFGGKIDVSVQCFLALIAQQLKRPVKMVYSREESFIASTKRHPFHIRLKHGATKDGHLIALEGEMILDTGAYASWGPNVLIRALIHGTGPYKVPNVFLNGKLVYTNNPTAGAFRGFGVPQITFAVESQMDILAEKLHLDPWDIRYRNALESRASTGTGQILREGVGIKRTLSTVKEFCERNPYPLTGSKTGSKGKKKVKRGRGFGSMFYGIGYTATKNPSPIEIDMTQDGSFHIYSGAVDMGQGTATFLRQIAAEDLKVPFDRIKITLADTDLTLDSRTTCASRTVYYSGNALRQAISNLKETISEILSALAGHPIKSLEIGDDYLKAGEFSIPLVHFFQICQARHTSLRFKGICDPAVTGLDKNGQGEPFAAYAYATQMADVEVNVKTGEVKVLRVVSAHDVGRAINPLLIQEQIEGAVMMGVGYALMEEFDPAKSFNFRSYKIPTIQDTFEIVSLIVEEKDPSGPFGAKGVAECALIPTAASVANAIANALGKRICKLPARPAQVRALFGSKE